MGDSSGRTYGEWLSDLLSNPASCGFKGFMFYPVALPVLILCGVLGLSLFPPGTYPTIILIAPGLILGAIVLYIYGYIVYLLPSVVSILLSLFLCVGGVICVLNFALVVIRQYF